MSFRFNLHSASLVNLNPQPLTFVDPRLDGGLTLAASGIIYGT